MAAGNEHLESVLTDTTKVDGAIVAELVTARSQMRQQADRIQDLELALDQTVRNLEELKGELLEQESLESHLAAIEETANVQQQAILQLKHQISQKDLALNQLFQVRVQPQEYDRVEAELAQQLQTQALLQQACQELEAQCSDQQARMQEIEAQNAEMQEQILQQMQQGHEYETAVQHWRDRYLELHAQTMELKAVLETVDLPEPVAAVLGKVAIESPAAKKRGIRPYQDLSVDLPGFLKRWQRRDET
jgi:chromosome segregation ATPase